MNGATGKFAETIKKIGRKRRRSEGKMRVIFTDMDGTLLNAAHRISERTERALKKWTEEGNHLVLSSSRGLSGIMPVIERYHLDAAVIALGGAVILDHSRKLIYERGMSREEMQEVVQFAEANFPDATWNVYTASHWIVKDLTDPRVVKEASIVEVEPTGTDLSVLHEAVQIGKVLLICDSDQIDSIENALKEQFPKLNICKSAKTMLEVNACGTSKGQAADVYCKENHFELKEAIAFGDNFNDLSMLKAVGRPILMGNAPEELKKQFTRLTSDNNHDGLAEALEKIL